MPIRAFAEAADRVSAVSRRSAIDRAAYGSLGVLRYVGRDVHRSARLDEAAGVVALVGTDGDPDVGLGHVRQHALGDIALGTHGSAYRPR
jgi:hypothetical protein